MIGTSQLQDLERGQLFCVGSRIVSQKFAMILSSLRNIIHVISNQNKNAFILNFHFKTCKYFDSLETIYELRSHGFTQLLVLNKLLELHSFR
jgi:hypothetical protein